MDRTHDHEACSSSHLARGSNDEFSIRRCNDNWSRLICSCKVPNARTRPLTLQQLRSAVHTARLMRTRYCCDLRTQLCIDRSAQYGLSSAFVSKNDNNSICCCDVYICTAVLQLLVLRGTNFPCRRIFFSIRSVCSSKEAKCMALWICGVRCYRYQTKFRRWSLATLRYPSSFTHRHVDDWIVSDTHAANADEIRYSVNCLGQSDVWPHLGQIML